MCSTFLLCLCSYIKASNMQLSFLVWIFLSSLQRPSLDLQLTPHFIDLFTAKLLEKTSCLHFLFPILSTTYFSSFLSPPWLMINILPEPVLLSPSISQQYLCHGRILLIILPSLVFMIPLWPCVPATSLLLPFSSLLVLGGGGVYCCFFAHFLNLSYILALFYLHFL